MRTCAENPANQLLPEIGSLHRFVYPTAMDGIRVDTGLLQGDEIGIFYDSMIAKLVAYGDDRQQAQKKLLAALAHTAVVGVKTNIASCPDIRGRGAVAAGQPLLIMEAMKMEHGSPPSRNCSRRCCIVTTAQS